MTLAAKLQEKRLEKGWTQAEAAERLGISRRQYIYYETGYLPPAKQIRKLNELFNYDFSVLVFNQKELSDAYKTIDRLKKEILKLKKMLHDSRITEW